MNNRILITYATRAGSTTEIAAAIAATMTGRGFLVDVKPIKEKPALQGYQAVLMGSAIRMGSWLPEAVEFIKTNQQILNHQPVALFTVHMLNTGDDAVSRAARLAYLNTVRPLLNKFDEVYFAGVIDLEKLSFLERWMVKMVKSPVGDQRDWDKICRWALAVFS
jgi:menaquinone-dependent protoporphyrinogen oxidase